MTKMIFEDLPSQKTPFNSANLNKLNNLVISDTEPTTGEEVWFKPETDNKIIYINNNGTYEEFINKKDIVGRELYNSTSGSYSDISLSDSVVNYKYIEIFYKTNDGYNSNVKVYNANGKQAMLFGSYPSTATYLKLTNVLIEEKTITVKNFAQVVLSASGVSISTETNRVAITRVLGYK